MPYLHHATMEPMNCTAHVSTDSCKIWVPTQSQTETLKAAMEVTGFSEDQIQIKTTLLGGGFGRRLLPDFVTQAVTVSKVLQKPVQVVIEAGANPFRGMRPQLDFACLGGSAREDCSDWTYFMNAYTMAFRGRAE